MRPGPSWASISHEAPPSPWVKYTAVVNTTWQLVPIVGTGVWLINELERKAWVFRYLMVTAWWKTWEKWDCLEVYRAFTSLILPADPLSIKNQVEETMKYHREQCLQQVVTMSDFTGFYVTVACAHIPCTNVHVFLQIHSVYVCTLYDKMFYFKLVYPCAETYTEQKRTLGTTVFIRRVYFAVI